MNILATRNTKYDFLGQSYDKTCYPNLHKYPATMIPQIGIEILKELNIKQGNMLDPYCGSGSSFAAGLETGVKNFTGYDINPLAILICQTRFTYLSIVSLKQKYQWLKNTISKTVEKDWQYAITIEKFNNFDYWFSPKIANELQLIKNIIMKITDEKIRNFFLVALSTAMRECSYTRNNEFKLYRIKPQQMTLFEQNTFAVFYHQFEHCINIYENYYHSKLKHININITYSSFKPNDKKHNIILTSPPYGDSKTTVAYGQFSFFSNQWLLNHINARAIDKKLMGGEIQTTQLKNSLIIDYIKDIQAKDIKRANEVASFYYDLKKSINNVSQAVETGGKIVYIVGNRTVKNITLPTDKFIAECFKNCGLKHLTTYERIISNKQMPSLNSPSNKKGNKIKTMNKEFIVVGEN